MVGLVSFGGGLRRRHAVSASCLVTVVVLSGCTGGVHKPAGASTPVGPAHAGTPSASTPIGQVPSVSVQRWARQCAGAGWGRATTRYDGMTYDHAMSVARRDGLRIQVLCADGYAEVGLPSMVVGRSYVVVAMAKGRIVFGRITEA